MTQAELITEIESQRKWLMFAGIDAYHMDVAFASILSAILEYSDTQGNVLEEIKDEIEDLTPNYDYEGFYYCQSMAMGIVAKHMREDNNHPLPTTDIRPITSENPVVDLKKRVYYQYGEPKGVEQA